MKAFAAICRPGRSRHGRESGRRVIAVCLALVLSGLVELVVAPVLAEPKGKEADEYQAKANWLSALAKFTKWPAEAFSSPDAPFIIGILGENSFGKRTNSLQEQPIQSRKVQVLEFQSVEEIKTCHILFISTSERRRYAKILGGLKNSSMLTISEVDEFVKEGGMVSLVMKEVGPKLSDIKPSLNEAAAKLVNLTFDPKLLVYVKSTQDRFK